MQRLDELPVFVWEPHRGAVPARPEPGIIGAVPQRDALPPQPFAQAGPGLKQQIVRAARTDPEAQLFQLCFQPGALGVDEGPGLLEKLFFLQCRHARRLGQHRDVPGLHRRRHPGQKPAVGAQAVPQPHPGHAVALGEGLEQKQLRVLLQPLGKARPALGKVQETFIQKQPGAGFLAEGQQFFQQLRGDQPPGGVVGIAEEEHLRPGLLQPAKQLLPGQKALFLLQCPAQHLAPHPGKPQGILRKGGGQLGGPRRAQRVAVGVDQLCRAVAAEDVLRQNLFMGRNGLHQGAAVGVGVAVHPAKGFLHGFHHFLRGAEGVGIGRKVQPHRLAIDVPAVGILCPIEHRPSLFYEVQQPKGLPSGAYD